MTDIKLLLPTNIYQALQGANAPSSINPFATIADVSSGPTIYTADSALVSTRTVDLAGFTLNFGGVGSVGVGIVPIAKFHIKGTTSDISAHGLIVQNSNNIQSLIVRNDGAVSSTLGYWLDNGGTPEKTIYRNGYYSYSFGAGSLLNNIGNNNLSLGSNNLTGAAGVLSGDNNIGIGSGVMNFLIDGDGNIGVGVGAFSGIYGNSNYNTGIGHNVTANLSGVNSSIALGANAKIFTSNQFVIGSISDPINDISLGRGSEALSGNSGLGSVILRPTNVQGGNLDLSATLSEFIIAGARGTGTGIGGDIIFKVAPAGTSGTTLNPLVQALLIRNTGEVTINNLAGTGNRIVLADPTGMLVVGVGAFIPTSSIDFTTCITTLNVSNIDSCSPLLINRTNNQHVSISSSNGTTGAVGIGIAGNGAYRLQVMATATNVAAIYASGFFNAAIFQVPSTQPVIILVNGNGQTTPIEMLRLSSEGHVATNGAGSYILFRDNGAGNTSMIGQFGAIVTDITANTMKSAFIWSTVNETNETIVERMRLTSAGNLGIKVPAPLSLLHLAAGSTTVAPFRFTSGTNKTTAAAGEMEYNGTDLFFTKTGTTRGTVYVETPRSHASQTLAINTARTPNATHDVQIIITFNLAMGDGDIATGIVQVDNSGGGTFVTIGTEEGDFSVTGVGVGGSLTLKKTLTFICPMGSQYKWNNTGTSGGTTTVTSIYELIL